MREVRWERMFPDELEAAFQACPVVYFTYGLCEPHGPHNTVGLDALKAHAIACEAAKEHGGIVAPPDYWHIHEVGGYASWAHVYVGQIERHWMTSLPPWQHFRNVCYHIRTADALGFHAAILLTGHYGPNYMDLQRLVSLLQPRVGTRLFSLPDFEANVPGFDHDNASGGDHAGRVETSLLWALEPDCVDMSRIPKDIESKPPFAMGPDALEADRRTGERMVADEVRFLGAKAAELLAEYDRIHPAHTFTTFGDVERFWSEDVEPIQHDLWTYQPIWEGQQPVPADSIWQHNIATDGYPGGIPPNTA